MRISFPTARKVAEAAVATEEVESEVHQDRTTVAGLLKSRISLSQMRKSMEVKWLNGPWGFS